MLTYALIAFAAVFFVVGVYRVVEFKAANINDFQRRLLIPAHVVGCGLFSASIVLVAIDPLQQHKELLTIFLGPVSSLPNAYLRGHQANDSHETIMISHAPNICVSYPILP
jgi:hypothetical protein